MRHEATRSKSLPMDFCRQRPRNYVWRRIKIRAFIQRHRGVLISILLWVAFVSYVAYLAWKI